MQVESCPGHLARSARFRITAHHRHGEVADLVRATLRWCGVPLKRLRPVRSPDVLAWEITARRNDLEFLRDELAGAWTGRPPRFSVSLDA